MIKERKAIATIESSNNRLIQTILHSEDQIITAIAEDELPTAAYKMNKPATKYSMNRLTSKRETMEMCGKICKWYKIELEGRLMEKMREVTRLGNIISE